jgi:hypothetical protein
MSAKKAGKKTQWVALNLDFYGAKTSMIAHTLHQSTPSRICTLIILPATLV